MCPEHPRALHTSTFTRTFPPLQPRSTTGASLLTPFSNFPAVPAPSPSRLSGRTPATPGLTLATQPKSGDIPTGSGAAPAAERPSRLPAASSCAGRERPQPPSDSARRGGKGRERPGREEKEAREREGRKGRAGGRAGGRARPRRAPPPPGLQPSARSGRAGPPPGNSP